MMWHNVYLDMIGANEHNISQGDYLSVAAELLLHCVANELCND